MPAALAYPSVQAALQRLGVATVTTIGTATAKERLRAEEVTDTEALALAAEVDAITVLITRRSGTWITQLTGGGPDLTP